MNKSGFTLTELLVTIVIIGVIMGLVIPSATRLSRENKNKIYEEYKNMMIEYAKVSKYKDRDYIKLTELDELQKVKNECQGYVLIHHSGDETTYEAKLACDKQENPDVLDPNYL